MKVSELITKLQEFSPELEVELTLLCAMHYDDVIRSYETVDNVTFDPVRKAVVIL